MKEASHEQTHIIQFHLHKISRTGKSVEAESRLVAVMAESAIGDSILGINGE